MESGFDLSEYLQDEGRTKWREVRVLKRDSDCLAAPTAAPVSPMAAQELSSSLWILPLGSAERHRAVEIG